jgi:hypothetical protein
VHEKPLVSRLRSARPAHPFDGHTERLGLGLYPTSGLLNRGAESSCRRPAEWGVALFGHADKCRQHPGVSSRPVRKIVLLG